MDSNRALVVENYSDLLMVISATMRQRMYQCDAVQDADAAIELLRTNSYSNILLDVTWPVATNPVIKFLNHEKPEDLRKVIIMTAFDPHYLGMSELAEICTFLKKPFGMDELFAHLAKCAP